MTGHMNPLPPGTVVVCPASHGLVWIAHERTAGRGGGGVRPGTIAGSRGGGEPIRRSGGATGSGARTPTSGSGFHLGLTRLYHRRRNFVGDFAARRGAGNRPVERSAGNPHETFVRGTKAPSCDGGASPYQLDPHPAEAPISAWSDKPG